MIFTMNETKPDTIEIDIIKHETIEIDTEKIKADILFAIDDAVATYFTRYTDFDYYDDFSPEIKTIFIKKILKLIDKEEVL